MLQGTLDTLNVADVLAIAKRKQLSGTLRFRASHLSVLLQLAGGRVAAVDSADISGHDLVARAEEATARLLTAPHGTFELQPTKHADTGDLDGTLDVKEVLAGARQRISEWRDLQRYVPGPDARPRLTASLDSRQITLSGYLWRVVQAIDGHRSVRSLAHQLGLTERELSVALKELVEIGAVAVEPGPAGMAAGRAAAGRGTPRTIVIRANNLPYEERLHDPALDGEVPGLDEAADRSGGADVADAVETRRSRGRHAPEPPTPEEPAVLPAAG